jgi:hypothetical protein
LTTFWQPFWQLFGNFWRLFDNFFWQPFDNFKKKNRFWSYVQIVQLFFKKFLAFHFSLSLTLVATGLRTIQFLFF